MIMLSGTMIDWTLLVESGLIKKDLDYVIKVLLDELS